MPKNKNKSGKRAKKIKTSVKRPAAVVRTVTVTKQKPPKASKKNRLRKRMAKQNALDLGKSMDVSRSARGCIQPTATIVPLSFTNSWGVILDTIDALLRQLQLRKPDNFNRPVDSFGNPQLPTIRFNAVRTAWLLAVQAYWYQRGVITSNDTTSLFQPTGIQIPNSLAKVAQQFLPYVDPMTGAVYKFQIFPLDPAFNALTNYPDVSFSVTSVTGLNRQNCINFPGEYYHVHPSNHNKITPSSPFQDLGKAPDGFNPVYVFPTNPAFKTLIQYFSTIFAGEMTAINSLCSAVDYKQLPNFAPDASAYAWVTENGISCFTPNFEPTMAIITGFNGALGTVVDVNNNYPFVKPLPVVRVVKSDGAFSYFDGTLRGILLNIYAYLTVGVSKFVGSFNGVQQLKYTECYGGIKRFDVVGTQIESNLVSNCLSSIIDTLGSSKDANSTNTNDNSIYALIHIFWASVIFRLFMTDAITDVNNKYVAQSYSPLLPSCSIPGTLARAISGLGPCVINGGLYIPYWRNSAVIWNVNISALGVFSPPPTVPYETTVWNSFYAKKTGSWTITDNDNNPIVQSPNIIFGCLSTLLFPTFFNYAVNMPGSNYSRWTTKPVTCLGTPNKLTTYNSYFMTCGDYGSLSSLVKR